MLLKRQGGVRTAAEIINLMKTQQEEAVITAVREFDGELAQKIIDEMFLFENLVDVDDRSIQRLLQEVDSESLLIALKGAEQPLREKFLRNMSQRAADILRDDLANRGPELRSRDWVPRSVRRNAREVAQAIGQLEQELGRNATETEVAERLGIDIADYRQMLLDTNNSQLFSYDEWREEHGDSIELVTDDHQRENPLQQLLDSNLRQRVMEAIETTYGDT